MNSFKAIFLAAAMATGALVAAAPADAATTSKCVAVRTYLHLNGPVATRCKARGWSYVKGVYIADNGDTINWYVVVGPYGKVRVTDRRVVCCA